METRLTRKQINQAVESAVNIVLEQHLLKSKKKIRKAVKKVSDDIYELLTTERMKQEKKASKAQKVNAKLTRQKKKKQAKIEIIESN
jgi:hypothetical protein